MRRLLTVALVLAALVPAGAPARGDGLVRFQTPSRNIACGYDTFGRAPALRCDLLSGLRPEPKAQCELDWTGVSLGRRGRATPTCAGDTVASPSAPVLAYGRRWRRGPFVCDSRRSGLTCRSSSGHGFFLSRARWRVW